MARSIALTGSVCLLLALAGASSAAVTRSIKACKTSFHEGCSGKGGGHPSGPKSHRLFFVAHDGRCPDTRRHPNAHDVEVIRAATLRLVNRERARHGERQLHWNEHLVRAAQSHTHSMAFGDYFAHEGAGGGTPLSRLRQAGYISRRKGYEIGENIAWGSGRLGTPHAIVAGWMRSPGHRANILDPRYRDTGVGVSAHLGRLAGGQSGGIYTQDFGVIIG
ncbi:MAG TPA: CAP domain-containing protein [Solirubrobacteraceae bacterium]|jgi:uncharacterized protein YkwD